MKPKIPRPQQTSATEEGKNTRVSFRERFIALKNLPALFRMVWNISKTLTVTNFGLRIARSVVPIAAMYVGKLIVDEIVLAVQQGGLPEESLLWQYLLLEAGIALCADIAGRAVALTDSMLGDRFANASSVALMRHAATLDLEQFEDPVFYDKLERARRQTLGRMELLGQTATQMQEILTMAMLAAALAAFNPWLIVIMAAALLPAFIGESHFNAKSYSLLYSWTPERRLLDYLRYTGASNETAKEVKIFGLSDFLADEYQKKSDEFYNQNRILSSRRAFWGAVLAVIGTVGYYSAYVVIISRALQGFLSVGDVTFLAGSFMRLRGSLESLLSRFSGIADNAMYLQDMFDFFAMKPAVRSPKNPRPFPRPLQQGFVFENVGFQYKNSDRWALRHISFELKPGEKLALVGENGAGKTTLVKLLSRLYDPTEGRILLDGVNLREYDSNDLRREIGVVFQDFVRFQFSAGDNIAAGDIEFRENEERIEFSAKKSLADAVIEKLPGRYAQMLGRRFGSGVELSGGEWQKIALARAYMRQAQVRILDEPTAALDARAEHEVFQRFAGLMENTTVVLISHRFSTVRMADRILVMENGMLIESGSHTELVALGGRYAELFALQGAGYL